MDKNFIMVKNAMIRFFEKIHGKFSIDDGFAFSFCEETMQGGKMFLSCQVFGIEWQGFTGYTCIILKYKENLPVKKHHTFERRKTKILLASALAAASVCTLASCADNSELPELPTTTLASTYQTESTDTSHTEALQTTGFEVSEPVETTISESTAESAMTETTVATTASESTAQTDMTEQTTAMPEARTETAEERITISYDTEYTYSDAYDKGTMILMQKGENGVLLRITVTSFEDDIATDVSVTEIVIQAAVKQIYVVGTRNIITYEEVQEIEEIVPFETETRQDDSRYDDEETVLTVGMNGYTEVTYRITYQNGIMISQEEIARETIAPIAEVRSVGTKPAWTEKTVTERESSVPYETEYIYDSTLAEGTRIVKTAGENGYTACVYSMKYYRGELFSRELVKSTVYEPQTEVVVIGTKKEETFGLPFYAGKGYTLTQDYSSSHRALDFGVWYGDPILSIGAGTVIYAYDEGDFSQDDLNWTYGTFVVIEHENGIRSVYAHLKSRTVRAGQTVTKGQVIGYSGNTGRVSPMPTTSNPLAGTHLHFEIRVNGVKVDPKDYIPDF